MKLNSRAKTISFIGIIVFIVSIIIFALTRKDTIPTSAWLGFGFVLFAEIVLFGGMIAIVWFAEKSEQIVVRAGCETTISVYALAVQISSLIYMYMDTMKVKGFLIVQIIFLALMLVVILVLINVAKSVKVSNSKVMEVTIQVNNMVDRINLLKSNKDYEKQLNKIFEDLKYSDISTSVEVDQELENKITKLELAFVKVDEPNKTEINELIEEIAISINKRRIQVKNTKVGGI